MMSDEAGDACSFSGNTGWVQWRQLGSTAIVLTTLLSGFPAQPAFSQAMSVTHSSGTTISYDIAAQDLGRALTLFADQAGKRLMFPSSLVSGRTSPGLSGKFTVEQALSRLLAGSGLAYLHTDTNAITIIDPNAMMGMTEDAFDLDTIVVTSGQEGAGHPGEAIYETPGSVGYVSEEQIKRIMPSSTGDILKSTPGVLAAGQRNGVSMDVNIRGMQGMNRVATQIDGAMQQSSSYRGYAGHDSRVFVDPEFIAGIDVTKGPGATVGAMGGTVNMRTLGPGDIIEEGKTYGIRLRGGLANNNDAPFTSVACNFPTICPDGPVGTLGGGGFFDTDKNFGSAIAAGYAGDFEVLAGIANRANGNYFAGTQGPLRPSEDAFRYSAYEYGEVVNNTFQNTQSGLFKLGWRPSDEHHLQLGFNQLESAYGELYESFLLLGNLAFKLDTPASEVLARTFTAQYRWEDFDNPAIDLRANAWATDVDNAWPSFTPDGLTSDVLMWGGGINNTSRFDFPTGPLWLTYGAEYVSEEASYLTLSGELDGRNTGGKRTLGGVFLRAAYEPLDWLQLNGGIRAEQFATENDGITDIPGKDGTALLPSVGVIVTPLDGLQLFASYAQGWRPPSIRESFVVQTGFIEPNPDLDPEASSNWEVGANYVRDGVVLDDDRLRFKAAWFDNDYKDYIMRSTGRVGDREIRGFFNTGPVSFRGFEVMANYDTGSFFVEASYNQYTDVEYCIENLLTILCADYTTGGDYSQLHIPPEYFGVVTMGLRFFDERLTVGGRVTFAGERVLGRTPGVPSESDWAAFEVYDQFASYEVSDTFTVGFSIENLTDRYYLDPLTVLRIPSPGRTVRVSLTAEF